MHKLIIRLFQFFDERPLLLKAVLAACVVLLCCAVLKIRFVEDISSFLPQNQQNRRINEAYQHIGAANNMMVFVAYGDSADAQDRLDQSLLTDAVEDFAQTLTGMDYDSTTDEGRHIQEMMYAIDPQTISSLMTFVTSNMPYYLTDDDYARMDSMLNESAIRQQLQQDKQLLGSPAGGFAKTLVTYDPMFFSGPVLQRLNEMSLDGGYEMVDGYIFNKEGTEAMLSVTSRYPVSETASNADLLKEMKAAMDSTMVHFGHKVKLSTIGAAAISVTNAQQIKKDSIISIAIALVGILLLLLTFFRDFRAILIILFSITFGALFGLAFLAIFKGEVSVIAIGAGSIIVGLAVNYPLHFLAHYQQGYSKKQTIQDIIDPLVTGNLTTVGSFLSLLFISSDAMKDLGLFSAMLLVGTILFVLVFLPHLFKKKLFANTRGVDTKLTFGKVADFNIEQHKWLVLVVVLLTIPLYYFSKQTTFETNMQAINYMTPDQRQKMTKLLAETGGGRPVVYVVSEGKTMDEALQSYESACPKMDELLKLGLAESKSGIGTFLPSKQQQEEALKKWNSFWSSRKEMFLNNFSTAVTQEGFTEDAFASFESIINKEYTLEDIDHFEPVISSIAENYISEDDGVARVYTLLQTDSAKVGKLLQEIPETEQTFAFDNRSMMSKMVNAMSNDFNLVLWVCGFIVFLFLTISFGRLELSMLSFLPLAVGWIWILGLMGLLDMRFNIVNVILATFIFGQGDDYTIFVTEGMMYEYAYGKKMLASYKNSVLLSASIMFIGIGSLILAKHPAMKSLAEVTIVGMFSVVLMAYLLPPLIFRWLTTKKGQVRRAPVTLLALFRTFYCFAAFLIVALVLTLVGFVLVVLMGPTKKHKRWFHQCLCAFLKFSDKCMHFITCEVHNEVGETFAKPAVIVANHQSHLDLLYLLMLNPNIICLTKKWVWRNPFYGWIIRFADFYPVDNGIEKNEEVLRKAVDKGYSVLIFPEGTRSKDGKIGRFHQGAFHLAQQLKVDILPIVTHGIGHVLPKMEFLLRADKVDIQILPRISYTDAAFFADAEGYETAKRFRKYFIQQYEALSRQCETSAYFRNLVLHNYFYKGREVELAVRRQLRAWDEIESFIAQLPDAGEYHIDNCGYGAVALLTALVKKDLHITATDADADKLAIASHCAIVPENLEYVQG